MTHTATITKNEHVATFIYKITARVENASFSFKSGQFVMINIPLEHGASVPKAFSIGSSAATPDEIVWYVQWHEGGQASEFFKHCKPGDLVTFEDPKGFMTPPELPPTHIVYVATTTGIAPYLSHLYEISTHTPEQKITVFFGCRYETDVFAQEELKQLTDLMPNLSVTTTLSQPTTAWHGALGRVTEHLNPTHFPPETHYYLCGNKSMIIDARKHLLASGIPMKNIKFEIFF